MILIGENINIMSKTIGAALRERLPDPIRELARAETRTGMDYLDLNIGPARKDGDELMKWLVDIVQEVTDKKLSLDTTNPLGRSRLVPAKIERLQLCSLQPERLEKVLPMAKEYDAGLSGCCGEQTV